MNIKCKNIVIALAFGALLSACKPTERNYEAAYAKASEAARLKAESESVGATGAALESLDGPRLEVVDGDSLYVGRTRLKHFEGEDVASDGNMGIAISKYSMPTNARRQLQDVKKEYPSAFIASDGQDGYYVIIRRVKSIPEAADPIKVYKLGHPDTPYLGLGTSPIVYFINPS